LTNKDLQASTRTAGSTHCQQFDPTGLASMSLHRRSELRLGHDEPSENCSGLSQATIQPLLEQELRVGAHGIERFLFQLRRMRGAAGSSTPPSCLCPPTSGDCAVYWSLSAVLSTGA
jgi:hypothetical protein